MRPRPGSVAGRWMTAGGALAVAAVAGLAAADPAGPGLLLLMLAGAFLALLLAPAWLLVPAVVVAGATTALVRLQFPGTAEVLGQGRVAALVAVLALFYALTRRIDFPVPRPMLLVAGLFAGSVLLSALVAVASGREGAAVFSAVQRELSQALAPLLVALIAFAGEARRLRVFRALAAAVIPAAVLSSIYWAWSSELLVVPSSLELIFENIRHRADDQLISPTRSVVPFVDSDPNASSAIFAILAGFCTAPLVASPRSGDRLLGVLVFVASAAAVLSTQSRMGLILLGCVGLIYLLFSHGIPGRARAALAGSVVVAGLLVATVFGLLFPEDRQLSVADDNLQSRMAIWMEAVEDVAASPWYGKGLGYAGEGRYFFGQLSIHNEYLQRFVDGGLIGGLTLLAVLAVFAAMALNVARRRDIEAAIGTAALAAMSALAVSMFVLASWSAAPFVQVLSWLIFGIISVAHDHPPGTRMPGPGREEPRSGS